MKNSAFLFLLLSLTVQAETKIARHDPEKLTVCSISLRKEDHFGERNYFENQLSKNSGNFNPIVELMNHDDGPGKDPRWTKNSCDVKCDLVVVFGKLREDWHSDGKDFPLKALEESSCNQKCKGVFENPLEVIMLGDEFQQTPKGYIDPKSQMESFMKKGLSEENARLASVAEFTSSKEWNAQRMLRAFGSENTSKENSPVLTVNPYKIPRGYEDRIKTINEYVDQLAPSLKKKRDFRTAEKLTTLHDQINNVSSEVSSPKCEIKEEHYCAPSESNYKEKLLKAYKDGDASVKSSLAGSLGKHFPNDSLVNSALEDTILNDSSIEAKKSAMLGYQLTAKSNAKILGAYLDGLLGSDTEISEAADKKLSSVMNNDFQKIVLEKVRGSSNEQRVILLNVFGRHGKISNEMEGIVIKGLQDTDVQIRVSAATILGYYRGRDPKMMEKILPLLNDTDERVRAVSVISISGCDLLPGMFEMVEKATKDPSPYVRVRAERALEDVKRRWALYGGGGIGN